MRALTSKEKEWGAVVSFLLRGDGAEGGSEERERARSPLSGVPGGGYEQVAGRPLPVLVLGARLPGNTNPSLVLLAGLGERTGTMGVDRDRLLLLAHRPGGEIGARG